MQLCYVNRNRCFRDRIIFCGHYGNVDRGSIENFHAVNEEKTVYLDPSEHRPFRTIALRIAPKADHDFARELYTRSVDHYRCRSLQPTAAGSRGSCRYLSPRYTLVAGATAAVTAMQGEISLALSIFNPSGFNLRDEMMHNIYMRGLYDLLLITLLDLDVKSISSSRCVFAIFSLYYILQISSQIF